MSGSLSPLRICLPTGIFPPDIGGPASYVPRVSAALAARGHSIRVVTLADAPEIPLAKYPFSVRRIRRGMPRLPRMMATVAKIMESSRRADVIFANGLFIEAAFGAVLTRKPLVMKIVGDWAWEHARNSGRGPDRIEDFQSQRQPLRWEAVKALRSAITRFAGAVIVPSRYLAGIVAGWGVPAKRISVIYNAVDPLTKTVAVRLPAFAGHTIITVARLVNWKGIDDLIACISERPELRLAIVGDGPERSALTRLAAERGASDRVIFAGNVSREEVAGWMGAAEIFVLNSSYEGLPHIVLEAFAAGVPVIATAAGGTQEVVHSEENGLLIPPGNGQALDAAIDRLTNDSRLRQRLIEGGKQSVDQGFHWENLMGQTESLLAAVAGRLA